MAAQEHLPVFPSRAAYVAMRQRVAAANKGLMMLKRKRDALEMKLRELQKDLASQKELIENIMHEALFSVTKANFLKTDFNPVLFGDVRHADLHLRLKTNKIAGLHLKRFELILQKLSAFPLAGLAGGGSQIDVIRKSFQELLILLVKIASLEFEVKILEEGNRANNMRINGLEYVVIPRFINTVIYIRDELEEYEREDFFRLKRSQATQRKAKENFQKLIKMKSLKVEEWQKGRKSSIQHPDGLDIKFEMDAFDKFSKL